MTRTYWIRVALGVVVCVTGWNHIGVAQDRASALGAPTQGVPAPQLGVAPQSDAVVPPPPAYQAPATDVVVPQPPSTQGTAPTLTLPASLHTRLRALDSDLLLLSARGGGNAFDGVLAILMGGLSITLGALFNNPLSAYLYLYGGGGIIRGTLSLVFMANPSGYAVTYAHMPMSTREEADARLEYGENALSTLASRAELSRILDGSLSVAIGLAIVPVYLAPNNFEFRSAFDYFVLIGAAVSVVSGVMELASTSEAERRWNAYSQMRDMLQRIRPVAHVDQHGGYVGAAGAF